MHNLLLMDRKSPPIALEARQYEALPVLAANSGRLTGNREVMSWSVGLVPTTHISSVLDFLMRCRLLVTYRISASALAIMHSPRSAAFRWPTSRRRRTTPPRSRSSNRLKQETARPSRFPQVDPSFPAGLGTRTSPSPPW